MRSALAISVLAGLVARGYSKCDNSCSGHGTCTFKDICQCWPNWQTGDENGGDCSDRACPFELAWVDNPDVSGARHKYAECAGRGICDRSTGECSCFDGYTGKACQRSTCPNDCSGHGRCDYMENLPFGSVYGDYYLADPTRFNMTHPYPNVPEATGALVAKGVGERPVKFDASHLWDYHKSRACVCDAGYTDVDCSRRLCPRGTDVLAQCYNLERAARYQVQTILLRTNLNTTGIIQPHVMNRLSSFSSLTFALRFTTTINETFTTEPIQFPNLLAGNKPNDTLPDQIRNSLLRLPGRVVDDVEVSVAFPFMSSDDWEDTYPLWDMMGDNYVPTSHNVTIAITFTGDYVQGPQKLIGLLDYECGDGCTPKIDGLPLNSVYDTSYVREERTSDFNNYECGRRGKCDYDTGLCSCFDGYTGEACGIQTALI